MSGYRMLHVIHIVLGDESYTSKLLEKNITLLKWNRGCRQSLIWEAGQPDHCGGNWESSISYHSNWSGLVNHVQNI